MKASKFTDAQEAFIIRQGEDGAPVADICRKAGISQAITSTGRRSTPVIMPSEMKLLRELEDENGRLKRIVADLSLDKEMLQDIVLRNVWFARPSKGHEQVPRAVCVNVSGLSRVGCGCSHLPLNRQSDLYAAQGIDLDVSTLADWVGACAATLGRSSVRSRSTCSPPIASMPTTRPYRCWRRENATCLQGAELGAPDTTPKPP